MLADAGRRFLVLLAGVGGLTIACSLALGAIAHTPAWRAVSLGFYLVGSFLLIAGFFIGNRGPVRLKREEGTTLFGPRFVRWAAPDEREETINSSALFVVLGFLLIVFGVAADDRYKLV